MSEALEALKRIEHDMEYVTRLDFVEPIVRGEAQQELSKIYHREEKDLAIIEKELKALEIIKKLPKDYTQTILSFLKDEWFISKENFNFLKEELK